MKSIQLKVSTPKTSSRKELLVRLVYWIPLLIVFYVLSLLSLLALVVNFFSVLIRGRVSFSFAKIQQVANDYEYKFKVYYSFLTDERPPIIPEPN
ncbi:MAG: DUF4389 domain-containing protein [Candidatus Micrarchaeota archaeon]|nr:DUF4389 domain-containing protein [Candidatus Micrarchaeota archaeon]